MNRKAGLMLALLLINTATVPEPTAAQPSGNLAKLFAPAALKKTWRTIHCNLRPGSGGAVRATFWKGYEATGFETTELRVADWSRWRSLKFDVNNRYPEPISVYVRISNQPGHPTDETYTGGTFDGFVVGPGRNSVEINLDEMRSPEEHAINKKEIRYLGIFFSPLFLRDGLDLKFTQDRIFELSNLRLDTTAAKLQKQPYAEPLFGEMSPAIRAKKQQAEKAVGELSSLIDRARTRGIETAYAEIYPFLANMAFRQRLVAFWQDREAQQRETLDFLVREARREAVALGDVLDGKRQAMTVPGHPDYGDLQIRDRYFRLGDEPRLIFGMLYNRQGPLLRWFANSDTDYGTELVAGGTRHDVERQPIWKAYHEFEDTHRLGWDSADHIIRDRSSWEVVGPPVNICLESPHSRAAVAEMIEKFERAQAGDREHLVQNLGFEYVYVCYCKFTEAMWRDWLCQKHADIESANKIWQTSFSSFDDVPMPRMEEAAGNRALWFDWSSFNLYRFLEQIRWTRDQVRRTEPSKPLTVGSPYYAFSPRFWTAMDEEELADSDITGVVLEENYELDTLMPEYLHAVAGAKPVVDFEYHGVIHQILPSFLHGDAAISMWWWNDEKHWTPNEPINEWPSSFPQSYTIPLLEVAKAMRDALDLRRLSREVTALATAPRPVALLYSKSSMLQHLPEEASEADTFPYLFSLRNLYNASQSAGVYLGLTTEKKILAGDLENRKVLVLPAAEFLPERVVKEILSWVERGGVLIVSPNSLLADEYARPVNYLESLGLRLARREPPKLTRGEQQVTEYNLPDLPRLPLRPEPRDIFAGHAPSFLAAGGRQIIECPAERVLAKFPDGGPALVLIPKGTGKIYWLASPLEPESWSRFLALVSRETRLAPAVHLVMDRPGPSRIEFRLTEYGNGHLAYFYNNADEDAHFRVEADFPFSQLIDRRTESVLEGGTVALPARETAIVEFR